MPPQRKQRPFTYSGCWTCKQRKVKYDETPSGCAPCAKKGVECGGYDVKLKWLTKSDQHSSSRPGSLGRRRIAGGQPFVLPFDLAEVDLFISELDRDAGQGLASTHGPFTVFNATPHYTDRRSSIELQSLQSEYSNIRPLEDSEILFSDMNTDAAVISTPPHSSALSDSVDALRSPTLAGPCLPPSAQDWDTLLGLNSTAEGATAFNNDAVNYLDHISPVTSPPTSIGLNGLWRQPQPYISDDPTVDWLFRHYPLNVANLLQPLSHPRNPYQSIYVPIALETLQEPSFGRHIPTQSLKRCLFHSIIATAAFHIHSCNDSAPSFHRMGIVHRQFALRCMQLAIQQGISRSHYREFMMALLSLITIGVMEGEIIDFQAHVHAILKFQKFRLDWKFMSSQTRQINTMSGFLSLLAYTTSYQADLPPVESHERSLSLPPAQHSLSFESTYGITEDIARAIEKTFKLYQSLNRYIASQEEIPEDLLEACEALGYYLNSWSFDHDKAATFFPCDQNMQMILNHHANAWHRATFIYYLQGIQGYTAQNVTEHVEQILAHMSSAEQIKSKLPGVLMAPITWPAFIASCSAVEREPWVSWWTQTQYYGIGSIKRQFEIVKMIWAEIDTNPGMSWLNVIQKHKIEVLAL